MSHRFACRVYYEDTDLAGIVYYANYLRFIERARSEWLRDMGIDQGALKAEAGTVFAVRRIAAEYLHPARFDDLLEIRTSVIGFRPAQLSLAQQVCRAEILLFDARVDIVALGSLGRAVRMPAAIRRLAGADPAQMRQK